MTLRTERCAACRPGAPIVTAQEAQELATQIPQWRRVEENGVPKLVRGLSFADAASAEAFVARLRALADEQDHHPSLTIVDTQVTVRWWTHAIANLHRNDYIMAARTDELYAQPAAGFATGEYSQ